MRLFLVTNANRKSQAGSAPYWARLTALLAAYGVHMEWVSLKDWQDGKFGSDATDALLVVDTHDLSRLSGEFAAMTLLRSGADIPAKRGRTFCVACSDWAAHCSHGLAEAVTTDRIIFDPVDADLFFPAERQRKRDADVPVVLHDCDDVALMDKLACELGQEYTVRQVDCTSDAVPDAMRQADVWLSLAGTDDRSVMSVMAIQAMATDLVVVTTDVGVFWQPCGLSLDGVSVGGIQGVVTCDWTRRADAAFVAACVRQAWQNRERLRPRGYARHWYGPKLFAQKWLEAIVEASTRLKVGPQPNVAALAPAAQIVGHPPRSQRER